MLHQDRENFEQVILKVSEDTGIDASIVEKKSIYLYVITTENGT